MPSEINRRGVLESRAADAPDHPKLAALLALWQQRRAAHADGRSFPARQDFSPFDFARLGVIGDVALIEVYQHPLRFRFRLTGVRVVDRIGHDPTGKWMHDLPEVGYSAYIESRIRRMLEERAPHWEFHVVEVDGRAPRTSEVLRLPLAADGEAIDMMLTCAMFVTQGEGRGP